MCVKLLNIKTGLHCLMYTCFVMIYSCACTCNLHIEITNYGNALINVSTMPITAGIS